MNEKVFICSMDDKPLLTFFCIGCDSEHTLYLRPWWDIPNHTWQWDGNFESPTIRPSVHTPGKCHLFIERGNIRYLPDCSHALAGKTVPMQEISEYDRETNKIALERLKGLGVVFN